MNMLDSANLHQVQDELTHHYIDQISNQDEHHVTVFANPNVNDVLIIYHPHNLDDSADNDGKIMPIRDVVIRTITDNNSNQWVGLANHQFIHVNSSGKLNLNFRLDNAITLTGQKRLTDDLKKFHVQLMDDGQLVSFINGNLVTAFVCLIRAIQFVNINGRNYVYQAPK